MASTIILSDNGASSGSAGLKQTAGNDGVLILQTTTSGGTATNAVYVDTSQNMGLGVTPSAWSTGKAIELNTVGQGLWATSSAAVLTNNLYYNGSYKFAGSGYASRLVLSGQYQSIDVSTTSGSAGGAITFASPLSTGYNVTTALQGANQTAGTGIAFPAAQSASSDANTLDDYEEGTWTPSLGGNTTYLGRSGTYTKIGNVVSLYGLLRVDVLGTGSTTTISGLPFTAASRGNGGSMEYWANLSKSVVFLSPVCGSSGQLLFIGTTAASGGVTDSIDIFQNGSYVIFGISFSV